MRRTRTRATMFVITTLLLARHTWNLSLFSADCKIVSVLTAHEELECQLLPGDVRFEFYIIRIEGCSDKQSPCSSESTTEFVFDIVQRNKLQTFSTS